MLKRIFTFILALVCLVAFSSVQTVTNTVKKHDSTTVNTTVVNINLQPAKVKSDFMDVTVITSVLSKMQKTDSVIINKLVELDTTILKTSCNSPPDKESRYYHKVSSITATIGVIILVVFIFITALTESPIPLKLGVLGLITLIIAVLYFLVPEIVTYLPSVFNDS